MIGGITEDSPLHRGYANFVNQVLFEAQQTARDYFLKDVTVHSKADDSPVTQADREIEQRIRQQIMSAFPDHSIVGEEFESLEQGGEYKWVIDPIDGTKSFITGCPLYGQLLALLYEGRPVLGAVSFPELNQIFVGCDGQSMLNDSLDLHSSTHQLLSGSSVYINEAEKILGHEPDVISQLIASDCLTRFGYDCHPHCLVASGRIEACVDYDLKPYDFLPLVAVLQGAGAIITDWQGKPLGFESDGRVLSSANEVVHAELLDLLASA